MAQGGLRRAARSVRSHRLVGGFVAALAPLATLMALQVVWLTDLDRASALAHKSALENCLEAIGNEIGYFYRSTAERLLNVPASLFESGELDQLARYWAPKDRTGVRRLFAVDFLRSPTGRFYRFVPEREALVSAEASDESLAVVIAALPFQRWASEQQRVEADAALHVSEQDPDHRIVLKAVTGPDGRVVGLVGLVIDVDYVRDRLVEDVVARTLPTFFPGDDGRLPRLTVVDGRGRAVLGRLDAEAAEDAVRHQLAFVLRDWSLYARETKGQARWASRALPYNLALGFAVTLALAAGVAIALLGARDAMRLSEMKSDFVSNVSHELRTPLASIRLFAEMMKRGRVVSPEKVVEYGTYIEAESRRLSRLIDNILDFARIESHEKDYRRERRPVLEVIEPVLDAVAVRLGQAGVRLERDLPAPPGPFAWLDPDAVSQALYNLLDNAAKYSAGSDEITVRMTEEAGHVVLSVEDHGIGIAKKDQARVFERFHRVGTGLVHDVKGSGLGLAIVDHTARAHGGRVSVESEPGEGSTFSLWLPLCQEESDGPRSRGRG